MTNFDFENSIAKIILERKKFFNSFGIKTIRYIFFGLATVSIILNLLFILGITASNATLKISWPILGITILMLFIDGFLKNKYFQPDNKISLADALKSNLNLANYLDDVSSQIISRVYLDSQKFHFSQVEPIVILNSLQNSIEGRYIFSRIGVLNPEEFKEIIVGELADLPKGDSTAGFSQSATLVMNEAAKHAVELEKDHIAIGDIFAGILKIDKAFQQIIFKVKIKPEDLENVIKWYDLIEKKIKTTHFWKKQSFGTSIAEDWSFGYTSLLTQFAFDYSETVGTHEVDIYGREKILDDMERVLCKNQENNVILIGDKGIGKNTLVEGLISKINQKKVSLELQNFRVFKLDTGALLSNAGAPGEIEARLSAILNDAVRAGNIILYIEDFHNLVTSGGSVGQVNASEIIHPYLKGALRIIASTNSKSYHSDVEANPSISQLLEKIDVPEPDEQNTINILEEFIPILEMRSKVFFTYQDLKELVRVATRYISDKPFPQKAIDLADEVAVKASKNNSKIIDANLIDSVVSERTHVPVSEPEGGEKEKLINLEELLHKKIINQEEAISAIANVMRRARSGLAPKNRPVGTFLFLGPTGVGKTETAKALAEIYFGSNQNMIRLDMSEFQDDSSVNRLIGASPGAGKVAAKGELAAEVKDKPFSLVLLDEMEKASKKILTLFLQVFDEGYLGSSDGSKINFQNTIVICTSNAGSELIREELEKGANEEELKKKLLDYLQTKGIFQPEFLNRFDSVIAFHPLSETQILQVAKLMLTELSNRMMEKDITLQFTEAAVRKLAKLGYDPVYGARPMRRTIQERVENSIAQKLLSGSIKRGDKVILDEKEI